MKKTLLAILLCLAMLAGNVHCVFAEETEVPAETEVLAETGTSEENEAAAKGLTVLDSGTCGSDMTWILYEDGGLVISGTGKMSLWGGGGSPWYDSRRSVKTVVMEDGVTDIGDFAFCECSKLTDVVIPDSVTRIGAAAFYGCSSLTGAVIPRNVTSIGRCAFLECIALESVTIPEGVTSIEDSAFIGCSKLDQVVIPDSVTSMGSRVFGGCSSLSGITIPAGVTSLEKEVLANCKNLKYVVILNDDIYIEDDAFISSDPVLYGRRNSAAEEFASTHGCAFREYMDGMEIPGDEPSQEDLIDISNAVVLGLSKVYYSGTPLGQSYEVYVDGVHLVRGQDYTAVYENNILPGEGRIVINGIGRYTGVKVATFEIGWNYYIYFDANGGEGEPHTEWVPNGSMFGLGSTRIYTMEGYHIASWNTKADGSGTDYLPDQKVIDLAGPNEMITVYAQWKRDTYTVRFYANKGIGSMEAEEITIGMVTPLNANEFTRSGYSFAGWNTQADGKGTAYPDRAEVLDLCDKNGEKISLFAQWKGNSYTVKFNANGGKGSMETEQMTVGVTTALIANEFTRSGYMFVWWNTRSDGTGTSYHNTVNVRDLCYQEGAEIVLYAQWRGSSYTIKFDANGGTGTMSPKKMAYDTPDVLTANAFKRTGYTFAGWNTKANGGGKAYENKATVKNLRSSEGAVVTLYAQWKGNSYTIKFNANGGSGTMASKKMIYGKVAALTANAFKRKGYTFTGWNTKADGSGKAFENGMRVNNLESAEGAVITFYAQWKANSYTIRFNANGGTGTMAAKKMTYGKSAALTANAFKRKGYTFTGWNTKADGSGRAYANRAAVKNLKSAEGAVITLYAQWKANSYTIRFNANGGTGTMAAKKMTYGKSWRLMANAFTRKGYSFTGWNTKADGSGKDYANKAVVKNLKSANGAGITLYAQWKKAAPVLTKLTVSGRSTVKEGMSIQLSCTKTPSSYKGSLTYSSSNTSVATVSSSGLVRGVSEGTATITVKGVNGVKATKKITVTSNSYDFGSAGAVSSYGSGVTIAPKRMSYSGSTLVLTVYIVNNSSYTIDGYNNLVITAYTDGGSRIVSKDLGNVDLDIAPHSIKTMTFRLSGASVKDLTGGGYLKTSGTCWFH